MTSSDLTQRQDAIASAFSTGAIPTEEVPIPSERLTLPPWAPPSEVCRDGILVVGCLDRAVTPALEQFERLVAEINEGTFPDNPRPAGAELLYGQAEHDSDPERRGELLLLRHIARGLVRAHTVLFLPHQPCGAYQDSYGHGVPLKEGDEWYFHGLNLPAAARFMLFWHYQLTGGAELQVLAMEIRGNKLPEKPSFVKRFVPKRL